MNFRLFLLSVIFLIISICLLVESHRPPLQLKSERGIPKHNNVNHKHGTKNKPVETNSSKFNEDYRLPLPVIPYNYVVNILVILDELPPIEVDVKYELFTAPGHARIRVDCVKATDKIWLHKSRLLNVDEKSVSVTRLSNLHVIRPTHHDYVVERDFYIITLDTPLIISEAYEINIQFVAPISVDRLDGLYRSFYVKPGSTERTYLAATQFQSVFARQVFPCFDEPHLKATFDITIGRSEKFTSLSNSKLNTATPNPNQPGWFWDQYEKTVAMSTYLIALVVSDFKSVQASRDLYRLDVKVHAAPHMIEQGGGTFAAETSARQLAFFEELYETNYTMHKMDSIAIPHFDAGAMENWGLNTYRPIYLLHFEGKTTERSRGLISNILAHELSHQWFGNLVTCDWWNAIWLNEGFATFISYIGWEETHPEFEPLKLFVFEVLQYSMLIDANPEESHPVLNDAITPEEIESYFDGLSYEKAGALIRMMEGFLGPEVMRQGLIMYLKEMSYKPASQDDLFRYLNHKAQEANALPEGGVTVKDIMDTWTLQSSFPLIRVSKFGNNRVLLSQERFSESFFRLENILDTNNLWFIPVSLTTQTSPNFLDHKPKFWLHPESGSNVFSHNTSTWIMLNPDATGYFRVLYDIPLSRLILHQIEIDHTIISPQSRSQLLDDYLNFAKQKYISLEMALQFTKYLGKETERIVWEAALANLEDILFKLRDTAAFDEFRKYLAPKLGSILNIIGITQLPDDRGAIVLLRALLLDWACQMDLSDAISYANVLFNAWKASPDPVHIPIPVDIRPIVYCAAVSMQNEGIDNFEFLFTRYENEVDPDIKRTFLNALGCAKDLHLIESLLAEILPANSRIQQADKFQALRILASSDFTGRSAILKFLRLNFDPLQDMFNGFSQIINVVSTLSSGMGTVAELNNVESFITENPALPAEDFVGSLAIIKSNIAWRAENEKRLQTWFSENI